MCKLGAFRGSGLSGHIHAGGLLDDLAWQSKRTIAILTAVRSGELITASFSPDPKSPVAVIVGRTLLFQLGQCLNLQESTRFDVLDERLDYQRSEIRNARTQFRFRTEEDARAALDAPPYFDAGDSLQHKPPAVAHCAMSDHIEIVTKSGTLQEVELFVFDQAIWSTAAMYHHAWLTTISADFQTKKERLQPSDCVFL